MDVWFGYQGSTIIKAPLTNILQQALPEAGVYGHRRATGGGGGGGTGDSKARELDLTTSSATDITSYNTGGCE